MISIIVPVYNVRPYLRSCLDSIIAQTYADWELILVDDGSTDGSASICDEYAVRDQRVQVIHQQNGGPARARNVGLALAKGEYVAFSDSDDLLHMQYLEALLLVMERYHADIVQSPYVLLTEQDRVRFDAERMRLPLPAQYKVSEYSGKEAIASMLYQQEVNSSPVKLFRRSVLADKVFPELFVAYEDLYAMLDIYAHSEKICCAELPIYYYFKRMDGTLNTYSLRDEGTLNVMKAVRAWIENYDKGLLPAVCSRELSMAFNILRLLSKVGKRSHDESLSAQCWQIIRQNRTASFRDPNMRLKNKFAILLSYLLCK